MNKQQLYTFGGALLASTALAGAANALTWARVNNADGNGFTFSTTPFSIANTLFSTTASTANAVTITPSSLRVGASFSNLYTVATAANTRFSVEITPTGGAFSTGTAALNNANFLIQLSGQTTFTATVSASSICASAIGFGTQFVIDGCTAAATTGNADRSVNLGGLVFSGVTFTNASGLATVGGSISLTGRIYNTATGGNFEAAATGNVITSAAPIATAFVTPANTTVSATSTPTAFTSLSSSNIGTSTLTMDLVTVTITGTTALRTDLTTYANGTNEASSATVTVTSALLSSGAVANLHVVVGSGAAPATNATVANFSGGSATFQIASAALATSFRVRVAFNGTSAIPQVSAGTASIAFGLNASAQAPASASGTTAATNQGGFRAELNSFNSSTNLPYSSYMRIHNNGAVAGTVTITVRNDDHASGAMLGSSFTTAAIQPNSTMQLSAAEIEGTATSTKLPSGGANIPVASRLGSYTVSIAGPIVGYAQHILFDGQNVADLSAFRNGGVTSNNAAP